MTLSLGHLLCLLGALATLFDRPSEALKDEVSRPAQGRLELWKPTARPYSAYI